jgi:hypothetical protein
MFLALVFLPGFFAAALWLTWSELNWFWRMVVIYLALVQIVLLWPAGPRSRR